MKKIASGITLVLLVSMLLLSGSCHSTESTSLAGVEKAINFLVHIQFNQSLGLCRESHLAPNVYWLVSDNLWAWKALKAANETYYFGAEDVGRVADEIEAKLKEDATLYNLPRDLNGFPISFMHEAVIGDVIPTPNLSTTILTLHSDDYTVRTEVCNWTYMPDWYEYADRLLYLALSCHWEGNDTAANLYFKNATDTWDGIGISDKATKADGFYATYKLALLLYTSKVLGRKLPFECGLVKRIWSLQRESDGGIITNYYANGTQKGDANTGTTSIVIIALLTSPRARLGTFAFYYPWYGTPDVSGYWSHWPPDGTSKITDHPLFGFYDSNNETLIEEHIGMAKEAGIGCFIVSWWGINHFTDNASRHIRNVCERNHFKFAFYYENTTSVSQTENYIKYILDNYANSSAYYKIDGRPVIYVYRRARDALNPDSWNLYFNGVNQSVNSASCWTLSEDIRRPPRYGIFAIEPHEYGIGYIENRYPIPLPANETYTLHIGISDIRNDFGEWSDVGFNISISNQTDTTTLYKQVVNFNQGWIDLPPFDVCSYAGSNVTIRAESFDDRNNDTWNSEWAAVDYFYISNSSGKPVNPDPYFDNGWNATINQLRGEGFNPYIIMDFQGYEGKIDDFVEYFKDCIDGIHLYYPAGFSPDPLQVLDIYNTASMLTHLENKTFIATVVPGFNNTAVSSNQAEALEHVVDRRNGACYNSFWLIAEASQPDGYAITSFNEWHEGTEIEPSREYGCQYIYLTRRWTIPEFSSIIIQSIFMIATLLAAILSGRECHRWRKKQNELY
jgi:hypothetical protein